MHDTAEATDVVVRPLAVGVGAEIRGVDLSRPLSPAAVAEIRSALLRWRVIFIREQTAMGPDDHLRFARYFGEPTPAHPTLPALEGYPQILPLESRPLDEGPPPAVIESRWHTDVTFLAEPPMGSILRALEVPDHGGDTHWTSLVKAYERLSEPLRDLVDGLHAVHRNSLQVEHIGEGLPNALLQTFTSRPIAAVHPVVRVHPETGERALFVNPTFTSHVVELSTRESKHLLALLYEHLARPEFTVRLRWEPGTVAFWDNRSTAHLAPQDLPNLTVDERRELGLRRRMQRITLEGDRPVAPDGRESWEIDAENLP